MDAASKPPSLGTITFVRGPLTGQTFQISKPVTTIGREASNDIVIKDDLKVSRRHAELQWNNGTWNVVNVSSSSTVTINQRKVQQSPIYDNTTIGLGDDTAFLFTIQAQTLAVQPEPDRRQTPPPPANPAPGWSPQPQPPVANPPSGWGGPQQVSNPLPNWNANQPQQPQAYPPPAQPVFSGQVSSTSPLRPAGPYVSGDATVIAPPTSMGVPTIELSSNTYGEKRLFPLDKPVINIGRDASNEIVINDRIISGVHLRIVKQGNQYVLIHPHPDRPKTLNGLLYQGRKIRGDEQFSKPLVNGDIFRIGDENGTIITLAFNDGTGAQQTILPPVRPIKLGDQEITIGRRPNNTVVLNHPQVSGIHARLVREGGSYRILDQNSTNHVYVNKDAVTNRLLKLGDEIRIGPYKLIYDGTELTQYDESNYIRIDALNLKKSGTNNVTLLNNLSFSIPPRKFVALVGGSGAGKSTLMDALNGLRPAHDGKVLYNGQDYYRNLAAFSTQLGYVPQDDIVHRDLTVERALYYAAKLRLPSDFTEEQIKQRINEVLEEVEMTRRRKLLVKKLSGGQRKRVSIALELLANPSLFFLDEPTSGLDPGLDRKMMFLLRRLADAGHTIVLVTHATNNINTCDYVCFLCQGGRLAYFGPPDNAKTYFGKADFAEIYSSLEPTEENPNVPEEAEAKFKLSPEYQEFVARPLREGPADGRAAGSQQTEPKRVKRGNPIKQFILLSQRNLELLFNDRSNLIILLLQAPLIALLLMLLIRFEVGQGIFDANNVVQCAPQIAVSQNDIKTPTGFIGIDTGGKKEAVDCQLIKNYLNDNANGLKSPVDGTADVNGTTYANLKGGVDKALQDFIVLGNSINAQRALFIISFVAVLFGCINGTREIVKESSIYRRERTVNLGIVPYILSKVLVLGLLALLQSAALLVIVQLFEPLHQGIILPVILETYITLALTALAGLMIGLTASAFAANEDSANSLLPFLLIPQVVFAGVEIPLKDVVLQTVAFVFPTRWAMVSLGSSLGLHSDKLGGDKLFGNDTSFHGTLFSTFSHADASNRVLLSWAALGGLILILSVAIGIALKRKDVRK